MILQTITARVSITVFEDGSVEQVWDVDGVGRYAATISADRAAGLDDLADLLERVRR